VTQSNAEKYILIFANYGLYNIATRFVYSQFNSIQFNSTLYFNICQCFNIRKKNCVEKAWPANVTCVRLLLQLVFSASVAAVKSRPVLHHCSVIFSGPQGSRSVHVCCLHLKIEFRSCARGCQWCGYIHYY